MKRFLASLLLLVCACGGGKDQDASEPVSSVVPRTLLVYYGYPSSLNSGVNGWDMAKVIPDFARYDYVVLGAGLEEGGHEDHANTVDLLASPLAEGTTFFGYIDLGITGGTSGFTLDQIRQKVDAWASIGADGLFLDDFGYDYGVDRARQNAIVDYAHGKGLPVVANAWVPADAFDAAYHATGNPGSLPTHLTAGDFYLCESYQIREGAWQAESEWQGKVASLLGYRGTIPFKVLTLTTNDAANAWSEAKFRYSWYSALLYGFEAAGWGEHQFAAVTCEAPFRQPPESSCGGTFTGDVTVMGHVYTRTTDTGIIRVDAATHACGFEAY